MRTEVQSLVRSFFGTEINYEKAVTCLQKLEEHLRKHVGDPVAIRLGYFFRHRRGGPSEPEPRPELNEHVLFIGIVENKEITVLEHDGGLGLLLPVSPCISSEGSKSLNIVNGRFFAPTPEYRENVLNGPRLCLCLMSEKRIHFDRFSANSLDFFWDPKEIDIFARPARILDWRDQLASGDPKRDLGEGI